MKHAAGWRDLSGAPSATRPLWRMRSGSGLPKAPRRGRQPSADLPTILDATRSMARSGAGGRMLPNDFTPWQTVYWWFRRLMRRFLFQTIRDMALMLDRERAGCEASHTAGVIESPSVKAPAPGARRGFDAARKVVGRKRHVAVDTDGRLLLVNLTPADIFDSAGVQRILDAIRKGSPWLKPRFVDGACDRTQRMDKARFKDFGIGIVRRIDHEPGFKVLPRRREVERRFGWLTRWRRLVRDDEQRLDVSEAFIHIAMGSLLLRRISHKPFSNGP